MFSLREINYTNKRVDISKLLVNMKLLPRPSDTIYDGYNTSDTLKIITVKFLCWIYCFKLH